MRSTRAGFDVKLHIHNQNVRAAVAVCHVASGCESNTTANGSQVLAIGRLRACC